MNATTANFSFLVGQILGIAGLRVVQLVLWAGLTALFVARVTSQAAFFRAAAVLVGVFVLLNSVVWVYFYLTVFLLMCAHAAMSGERVVWMRHG
jgi:hypothetical protein